VGSPFIAAELPAIAKSYRYVKFAVIGIGWDSSVLTNTIRHGTDFGVRYGGLLQTRVFGIGLRTGGNSEKTIKDKEMQ